MLAVSVNHDGGVASAGSEASRRGRLLAKVAREADIAGVLSWAAMLLRTVERFIAAPVIHVEDLKLVWQCREILGDLLVVPCEVGFFVEDRNDDANHGFSSACELRRLIDATLMP